MTFVRSIRKKVKKMKNVVFVIDAPVTEYANDIRPLSAEAVQEFLDVNEASDSDEMHVFRAFDSAYDRANFLRNLAECGHTEKYVKPGTFRRYD